MVRCLLTILIELRYGETSSKGQKVVESSTSVVQHSMQAKVSATCESGVIDSINDCGGLTGDM